MVAESLAEYLAHCCQADTNALPGWKPRQFAGHGLKADDPALQHALNRVEVLDGAKVDSTYFLLNKSIKPNKPALHISGVEDKPGKGMLNQLWQAAVAEWQ